ncbi:hypothetical protein IWX90DRAFT_179323 [Phyllosticta citrichinensis]|uniref:Uncharacterized protein n=1 Tax=Phyllosticta citrichinensis TaxID=1130410 RepID=A0ABR1XVK8_9PEZI
MPRPSLPRLSSATTLSPTNIMPTHPPVCLPVLARSQHRFPAARHLLLPVLFFDADADADHRPPTAPSAYRHVEPPTQPVKPAIQNLLFEIELPIATTPPLPPLPPAPSASGVDSDHSFAAPSCRHLQLDYRNPGLGVSGVARAVLGRDRPLCAIR